MKVSIDRCTAAGRRAANPSALLATLLASGVLAVAPSQSEAACNLIPSDPDRFQSVIGATNRPFAGPGETLEIAVVAGGCDARSAGVTSREATGYVATYVFKPKAGAAQVIVVADDCASRAAALDQCRAGKDVAKVTCQPLKGDGAVRNIELLERKGVPVFSLRFPDTDAFVDEARDGHTLTGPVAVALTAAADPLPCELAASACATLPEGERLVACVDEMHGSDGTCALGTESRHAVFPQFLALPPMNSLAKAAASGGATNVAFSGSEVLAATDGAGNLLVPIDWRLPAGANADRNEQHMRGRHALDALGTRLGAPAPLVASSVSAFTAWGRPLPALYDPAQPRELRSLFEQLDVPLTVLRVAPRTCTAGASIGKACSADSECAGSTCAAAAFVMPKASANETGPIVLVSVTGIPSPAAPAAVESDASEPAAQLTAAAH